MLEALLPVLLLVFLFLYLYFQSIYQYWTKKGLPQPTPFPLVGNVSEAVFKIKNIGLIQNDMYWQYRDHDAVGYYQFLSPKLMLIKSKLFKQLLISEFSNFHDNEIYASEKMDPYLQTNSFVIRGDKWKESRAKLTHGLTPSKLRDLFALMSECMPHLNNYITEYTGKDIEALEMSSLFIMTTVSNSVFGIDNNCFVDRNAEFRQLTNLLHREYWHYWWQTMLIFYLPKLRDLLRYRIVPSKISAFMADMVRNVAEVRKKNNIMRRDFIQSYLGREKPYEENVLDMINNGMVFMIAGMEPSVLVCTNTLYALALNPDVQENLYQELLAAYPAHSHSALSYETLMGLPYLDKVIKESMRKYPITYHTSKVCTKSTVMVIDSKDVTIEAGTLVMIPTISVHHDPEYYPDPEVFDPERFNEENMASRPECTYLPWGEGPRICPGKKFAEAQMKLYLSHIVYNYRILPAERTPSKLTYNNFSLLVVPSEQMWIRLEKRE